MAQALRQCDVEFEWVREDAPGEVAVSVTTVPQNEFHREMIRSVVHLVVLDLMPHAANVYVMVPMSGLTGKMPPPVDPVAEWVHEETETTCDLMDITMRNHAERVVERVVHAYPWRNRILMVAQIPLLVEDYLKTANVDNLVPPSSLCQKDAEAVFADATRATGGRTPRNRFDIYEAIYGAMSRGESLSAPSRALYHLVFDC